MKILARIDWFYSTVVIFIGLFLKIVLYPFLPRPYASKAAAWFIRLLIFVHVKKVGNIDPEAQMFIINHQSELDIGVIESATVKDLAWVAKKELFEVPFFSLAVRLSKDIPLERESKSALVALLKAARDRVEHGRTICIFPEGTRSETGKMRAFKPGAKLIAEKLGLKVQPVVLIGTAEHFSTKKMMARPGMVTAVFLESFTPDKNNKRWLGELQKRMQETHDRYAAQ
ncbi:MAG TPA: 1-acyl-sn-glycerol-3-phosphate acyltransferase [Sulfuricurvum sp.]|nr:1-acyl-sn-glycerol-3-phosphate acyltransferase [Sulfuricurvum sp.]